MKRILEIKNFKLLGILIIAKTVFNMIISCLPFETNFIKYILSSNQNLFFVTFVCSLMYLAGIVMVGMFFIGYDGKINVLLPIGLIIIGITPLIYWIGLEQFGIRSGIAVVGYLALAVFAFMGDKGKKASIITLICIFASTLVGFNIFTVIITYLKSYELYSVLSNGFYGPISDAGNMLLIGLLIFYLSKPAENDAIEIADTDTDDISEIRETDVIEPIAASESAE